MELLRDYSKEFQEVRRTTWSRARPWVLLLVVASVAGLIVGDVHSSSSSRWEMNVGIVAALAFCISLVRLIFLVNKLYRCPACGMVVVDGMDGMAVNPKACSKCGVRLAS